MVECLGGLKRGQQFDTVQCKLPTRRLTNARFERLSPMKHLPAILALLSGWLLIGPPLVTRAAAGDQASAADAAKPEQSVDKPGSLADAQKLFQHGSYAEAEAAFRPQANSSSAAASGLARCQSATGHSSAAGETLLAAIKQFPKSAAVVAELADLEFAHGQHPRAQELTDAALKLDDKNLAARWRQAELQRVAGQIEAAKQSYFWIVKYYNDHDVRDAESLCIVAQAAAQHARWNQLSDDFQMLISELYPEAAKIDADHWQSHLAAGLLLLEKYNESGAAKEFHAAQAINPHAAEIQTALAAMQIQKYDLPEAKISLERALRINPKCVEAYQLRADLQFINCELTLAVQDLETALKINPVDEGTLGRLAAALGELGDFPTDVANADLAAVAFTQTRTGKIFAAVNARNPHAGAFYAALAESLDNLRKYPASVRFYREAIQRQPELTSARSELGMVEMRLGQEALARKTLDEAFRRDPFHVRVNNTIKVLDVLDHYAVLETEHFVIKFDRTKDEVLAKAMGQYLEHDVFPEISRTLAYTPQEKTLFEVFNSSGNTDGHGWFSARMVGLPSIGTVGACAGKMVALTSPDSMQQKFNWARVVRHEFVHVVNLQQTHFNIPHWYTEGLAVANEGAAPPASWDALLIERQSKHKLFDLSDINLAFSRPKSADDWQMAYCQAHLYVKFMEQQYGIDANAKMLREFAKSADTTLAIKNAFSVSVADFERDYRTFVDQHVAGLMPVEKQADDVSVAEFKKQLAADPQNPDLLAKQALNALESQEWAAARESADAALEKNSQQPLAAYVLARLLMRAGDVKQAVKVLNDSLDRAAPNARHLALLAGLKLKAEDYSAAAELYELGKKLEPGNIQWTQSLARVYLKMGDDAKLMVPLAALAEHDFDDAVTRKKLAQLALNAKDFAAAKRWATEVSHIEAKDLDAYLLIAKAAAGQKDSAAGIAAYELAILIDPKSTEHRLAFAKLLIDAKRRDDARQQLNAILKIDAKHPEATQLLESLKP